MQSSQSPSSVLSLPLIHANTQFLPLSAAQAMNIQSLSQMPKFIPSDFLFRARMEIIGIAQDFWKDGQPRVKAVTPAKPEKKRSITKAILEKVFSSKGYEESEADEIRQGRWKADRVRVKEKLWGDGNVIPTNKALIDSLIMPFGLTKEMSALDLSAGLGGLARIMARDFRCYATGLEQDKEIAERGMAKSVNMGQQKHAEILHYDPETFEPSRHYDCIIMRDLLSHVRDKKRFIKAVVSSLKGGGGQLAMTDYVLDHGKHDIPAIKAWLDNEKSASPGTLDEMTKVLTHMGLDVRIGEDLTPAYLNEIMRRLGLFAAFLAKHPPEATTKPLVLKEIEFWATRAAALQQGLKFCRFYAIRH